MLCDDGGSVPDPKSEPAPDPETETTLARIAQKLLVEGPATLRVHRNAGGPGVEAIVRVELSGNRHARTFVGWGETPAAAVTAVLQLWDEVQP